MREHRLNLFYEEPDDDRWLPLDRYPRRLVRRVIRGPRQIGGMERYFVNLADGLRRIGAEHSVNAFRRARHDEGRAIGIVGKGHVLRKYKWHNPIVFGPAVFSHPLNDLGAFVEVPIRRVLVSCDWLKAMYEITIDAPVKVWPSGIDTYRWRPGSPGAKSIDVLIYDKVRWQRSEYEPNLINRIVDHVGTRGLRYHVLRYGKYREPQYEKLLQLSRSMIFLVEHETQGFAYLQALSCGVPIFAWDRGGAWQDPEFYPHRVHFTGVTSVPYWDERCGMKFSDVGGFIASWDRFWSEACRGAFNPREYVVENLTLERCAREYLRHIDAVS